MSLQHIPNVDRPRERLLNYGVDVLTLSELLAILLTTGTKGKSVVVLAQEIVGKFGGLKGLLEASIAELMEIKGIGKAKAVQLKAAFGIALKNSQDAYGKVLSSAREAYNLVKDDLCYQKQEVVVVILKDIKGRYILQEKVAIGTLSQVLVHPREVFYPAVRHKAFSLILAHNHPSGDPTPSQADLELTRNLLRASKVMGIRLDDHLIIGRESFISLGEVGLLG